MDRPLDGDGAPPAPQPAGVVPAGTGVSLGPARLEDPVLHEVVWRTRRLADPGGGLAADAEVFGDHLLNPHLPRPTAAPRRAAVLLALGTDGAGRLALVLTERAAHLSAHAGQIALPGGKIEPGETPAAAALREAREETEMPQEAVVPLGLVETYVTGSGFSVVPVVGLLRRPVLLRPEPGEVAAVFSAPWADVMDPARHREVTVERNGVPRRFHEVTTGGRRVWGVTAGILRLVHARLYRS